MLAGDDKALFDNCFGQQGQQLILREEIVYVPRATLGGTGPALHCGFPLDAETPIVSRPCPFEEEALDDEEGSEWVKEMMIYGSGRSNWGSFKFRGRVRAYDGLITLLKEYAVRIPSVSLSLASQLLTLRRSFMFRLAVRDPRLDDGDARQLALPRVRLGRLETYRYLARHLQPRGRSRYVTLIPPATCFSLSPN